jgi:hypothetical protein
MINIVLVILSCSIVDTVKSACRVFHGIDKLTL